MVRAQPNCSVPAPEILIAMIAFALCMDTAKALQTSKTLNSLLYPDTASLHSKLFRFRKSRQWGLCSRKMQVSQQINKTKIDPGDKHFSLGHLQCGFLYQTQVILVNRAGNLLQPPQWAHRGQPLGPQHPPVLHFLPQVLKTMVLNDAVPSQKLGFLSRVFHTSCSPIHSPPCDSNSNILMFLPHLPNVFL